MSSGRHTVLVALGVGALLAGRPQRTRASFDECLPIRLVTTAPKPGGEVLTISRPSLSGIEVESVFSSRCGLGSGQLVESEGRLDWSGSFRGCPGESLSLTVRGRDCRSLRLRGSRARGTPPHRRRVRAKPSVCGDGVIDLAGRESCEPNKHAPCRPGGRCAACRCVGTPAAPPSVSIDDVSCAVRLERFPGACGLGKNGAGWVWTPVGGGRARGPVGTILSGHDLTCDAWQRVDCVDVDCCGRSSGDPESTGWFEGPLGKGRLYCGSLSSEIPTALEIFVTGPFDTEPQRVTRSLVCRVP